MTRRASTLADAIGVASGASRSRWSRHLRRFAPTSKTYARPGSRKVHTSTEADGDVISWSGRVHEKVGFLVTGQVTEFKGIRFVPMERELGALKTALARRR